MSSRRPILKRIAAWTAAAAMLLVAYVAGAPFVTGLAARKCPSVIPALVVAYAPLVYLTQHDDVIGHETWARYVQWCENSLNDLVDP